MIQPGIMAMGRVRDEMKRQIDEVAKEYEVK